MCIRDSTCTRPATPEQIAVIVENMPDKYRALILIAAWCGLRWGEVSELRRKDIDLRAMAVRVERAVVWRKGQPTVGGPKSRAGVRTVAMPPNLRPALTRHLKEHAMPGEDGLLFPNCLLYTSGNPRRTRERGHHGSCLPRRSRPC